MPIKNEPVGGHAVDLLLDKCFHIKQEKVEAAIYLPNVGEKRFCETCQAERKISKVGSMYWTDEQK